MQTPYKKVYLRGDGSTQVGMGHIMRLYSVSRKLVSFAKPVFALVSSDSRAEDFLKNQDCLVQKFSDEQHFLEALEEGNVVILDGYNFSSSYFQRLKETGARTLYIDDLHDRRLPVDVVINHTPGLKRSDFDIPGETLLFLGPDYCMIRPEFLKNRSPRKIENVTNVVLTLGMSESGTLLSELLLKVLDTWNKVQVTVLPGANRLPEALLKNPRVTVHSYLSEIEMVELFDHIDLAIVPVSTVYLEALSRNCLVAGGYFVNNQEVVYNQVSETGIFYGLGDFRTLGTLGLYKCMSQIVDDLPRTTTNSFAAGWEQIIETIKGWEN